MNRNRARRPLPPSGAARLSVWAFGMLCVLATLGAEPALAQRFGYPGSERRAIQSLSVAYLDVDFHYDGKGNPNATFDYRKPAVGIRYARPGTEIEVAFGSGYRAPADTVDMGLLDVSLLAWGEFGLYRPEGKPIRLTVPIALHSGYRRAEPETGDPDEVDAFKVTVLGIGAGLGFSGKMGKGLVLEARSLPIVCLATRAFGESTGSSFLLDSDVNVHLGPLVRRFGLSLGYGYRIQRWNVNASDLFSSTSDNYFDYLGSRHVVRAGLNW